MLNNEEFFLVQFLYNKGDNLFEIINKVIFIQIEIILYNKVYDSKVS